MARGASDHDWRYAGNKIIYKKIFNLMKIDFIYDCAYPFSKGGAEKRIYTYSKCLSRNMDTRIVSMKWWRGDNNEVFDGMKYLAIIPLLKLYNKNGKRRLISSLLFGLKAFVFVLKSDANLIDFDVFPYFPIIFAKLASIFKKKKPLIIAYWCECFGKTSWKRYAASLWFLGLGLEKLVIWSADIHITDSEFTKNKLAKLLNTKSKKISVIPPSGINYKQILDSKVDIHKKYDLIYYGRLIKHKNVDKIIKAVASLRPAHPGIKLIVIGNGPDKDSLIRQTENLKLGNNVSFYDFVDDYNELLSMIKEAKILVAPSEREGFGISIIEANACGLPAIVMDFPDNSSKELIIEGENGFVCSNDNDLFRKIEYLCYEANYLKISRKSLEAASKYDMALIENQIRETYLGFPVTPEIS